MHLGIFLGHFPSLPSWPHHERVHGALYMLVMQRFRRHLDRYSSNLLRSLNRPLLLISNYYLSSVSSFRIVSNNFSFRARASSSYLRPVDHVSRRVPLDASSSSIPLRATFDHVAGQSQQFAHATTTPPPSTILLNLGNEQTIREEFPILVQLSSPLLLVEILLEKFTHPFPSKLTRSILLIFRLSSSSLVNLTHSHPSSFNVNSPRPWNPSNLLLLALFHSPIPGEFSVPAGGGTTHWRMETKRGRRAQERYPRWEAVWLIPWRGLARIRQDPLWRRVWDEAGRNRESRGRRGETGIGQPGMFLLSHHVPRLMDTHDWLPRRHGGRWIQPRSTGGGVLSPRPFSTTAVSPSLSLPLPLARSQTVVRLSRRLS